MVLSTDPPFLFLHIPKTAGSSIEEVLYPYSTWGYHMVTHGIALQYKHWLNKDLFDSLFKFGFVRNPWDLQVSCYYYYIVQNKVDMTFDEYIEWKFLGNICDMESRLPKNEPGITTDWLRSCFYIHRTPQTYFMIDEEGNYILDYIGAFEYLQEDFDKITNKIGIENIVLFHTNASHKRDREKSYKEYYNEKTKKIVEDRYYLDLVTFGYQFETPFPEKKLIGLITQENNSIQKRGFKTPPNFYFTFGDLPYGLTQVKAWFNDVSPNEIEHDKNLFKRRKYEQRQTYLRRNLDSIVNNINELESEINQNFDNPQIYNKNRDEILSLMDKKLRYSLEDSQIDQKLQELERTQER